MRTGGGSLTVSSNCSRTVFSLATLCVSLHPQRLNMSHPIPRHTRFAWSYGSCSHPPSTILLSVFSFDCACLASFAEPCPKRAMYSCDCDNHSICRHCCKTTAHAAFGRGRK